MPVPWEENDGDGERRVARRRDNVIRGNPIFHGKKNDLHKPFTGNGETELRRVKGRGVRAVPSTAKETERRGKETEKRNLLRENMKGEENA